MKYCRGTGPTPFLSHALSRIHKGETYLSQYRLIYPLLIARFHGAYSTDLETSLLSFVPRLIGLTRLVVW